MSRYAESLNDWADLHGETIEPEPPTEHACPSHGPHTPRSLLDADCPACDAEAADALHDYHVTKYTH
jgi:hypothetical protein